MRMAKDPVGGVQSTCPTYATTVAQPAAAMCAAATTVFPCRYLTPVSQTSYISVMRVSSGTRCSFCQLEWGTPWHGRLGRALIRAALSAQGCLEGDRADERLQHVLYNSVGLDRGEAAGAAAWWRWG